MARLRKASAKRDRKGTAVAQFTPREAGRRRRGWRRNEGWRPFRHRPPQRLVHGRPTRGNRNGQHTGHWHRGAVRGPGLHFLRGESRPPVVARPPQVAGVPPSSVRWLSAALSLVKTRRAPLTLWKRRLWLSDTFRGRRGVRSAGKSAALSERLLSVFLLFILSVPVHAPRSRAARWHAPHSCRAGLLQS